jgi:hypothetical protein
VKLQLSKVNSELARITFIKELYFKKRCPKQYLMRRFGIKRDKLDDLLDATLETRVTRKLRTIKYLSPTECFILSSI